MDFRHTIALISEFAEQNDLRHAVIGGLALAAYGSQRTTLDLDLLVEQTAQTSWIAHLESLGYATLFSSVGFSNHLHPDSRLGRVDLVYVAEATAAQIFPQTGRVPGPGESLIPIPRAEHLIAMKVVAMKNDRSRTYQDLADIQFLLSLPETNRSEARVYFEKHGLGSQFDELEEKL